MNHTPTGSGIKIAVIDTGCQLHKDLQHSIIRQISLLTDDDTETPDTLDDENGHGTFVAGIIAGNGGLTGINGVAIDAKIVSIKAADKDGKTDYSLITQGIYCAVLEGCDIINISIGGDFYDNKLHEAIKYAHNNNIPVICASGNDGHMFNVNLVDYPAKFKETIAVGGCDNDYKLALFSTIGKEIDFVAPSININSTFLNNTYKMMSGTSFSAPYVTGVVALYLSLPDNKDKTPEEIKTALIKASIDLGISGKDVFFGNGIININKVLNKNTGALKSALLHIKSLISKLFSFIRFRSD